MTLLNFMLAFWCAKTIIPVPTMEKTVEPVQADESADLYQVIAWLDANRKQVITITLGVLVVAAIAGGVVWKKSYNESQANNALGILKLPNASQTAGSTAADFVKIADDYPGTKSAARALLIGGGMYFDVGKLDDARAAFDRFMGQYASSPLANQALLGIAACLEAQGKTQEAASHYEDLKNHYAMDSTTPQVKSALARCYVALNKPELAKAIYEDLIRANSNDTWSAEARSQLQELLSKYPNLVKPASPTPVLGSSAPSVTLPAVKK